MLNYCSHIGGNLSVFLFTLEKQLYHVRVEKEQIYVRDICQPAMLYQDLIYASNAAFIVNP